MGAEIPAQLGICYIINMLSLVRLQTRVIRDTGARGARPCKTSNQFNIVKMATVVVIVAVLLSVLLQGIVVVYGLSK